MIHFFQQHGIRPGFGVDISGSYISYCPGNNSHFQQQTEEHANVTGRALEKSMWSSTCYWTFYTTAVGTGIGFFKGIRDATTILSSPSQDTPTENPVAIIPRQP